MFLFLEVPSLSLRLEVPAEGSWGEGGREGGGQDFAVFYSGPVRATAIPKGLICRVKISGALQPEEQKGTPCLLLAALPGEWGPF